MRAMTGVIHPDLPHFVAFGEALTELLRTGPDSWRSRLGGSPWQVAVAMSTLGEMSAFAGAVSNDLFGQALWSASGDAHLDLRFIQQLPHAPLLNVIHPGQHPEQFLVGQDSADLHFRPEGLPAGWLRALRWAHFGGLSLSRPPLSMRLLALAEALKAEGKKISYAPNFRPPMDTRYDDALERMCRLADVIKVSEAELCGLFRSKDYHPGLAQISAWNPEALLLVNRGALGATLYAGAREWHAAPPPTATDWADKLGVGDASLAGLLFCLIRRPDAGSEQQLAWAVAAGTAAGLAPGFSPPSEALVATLAAGVRVSPGA